ncbi:trafficking protein particle complex subunit 10 [Leucosporidium creatinivorum]|uniref:Trafficking protein particle complex subunit 10 n=1 Tax=Leucosporidium creatinivorum TaxID=106004 RepID=A0A1Y2EZA2_9BASI|nr:trafficking protein particle complex subunit 10 [Leucosporidium creatinivorum]
MKVRVSYEALPGPGDYEFVRSDVDRQLPLRNLHWVRTSGANRSIRTIQSLPVDFRPLHSFGSNQGALSLLERPYLHLLFVVCDDNETYRATIRTQIREWLDSVIARQNQEWLIVHVTSGRSAGAKFYQRKGAVVDKIKADFNTGKKDRCIQVFQAASAEDPTAWAEFTNKVKEGIIATFDSNVSLYEEDVRKADSQRQLEGWQYLPFFLQKEALADSFESMNLFDDALVQYDELEASFFQAMKEHNMSSFGKVGGLAPGDDALPLLSTTNKPYRKLIQTNDISIFDFRIYLFARQAAMLFHLGKITEVAKRGAFFISTFARRLREDQNSLGQNFVESWTYSACLSIVDDCQRWVDGDLVDKATAASFLAVKAELLELARKQLDKIGIGAGHLPLVHPFSMSLNETVAEVSSDPTRDAKNRPPVSRRDLIDAVASREVFDKLYIDLTNRSIQAYQGAGRKRCSLKLHASLAALEDHRDRQASAQKLYSHLPAHYVDLRWVKIESSLLTQCTRLQGTLDMSRERLLSTLALIRAGVEFGSKSWSLDAVEDPSVHRSRGEDMTTLAKKLMDDVYSLSSTLSKDFAAIAFPTFSMRLASEHGSTAADEDGVTVPLIIKSLLPCTLKIDEVRLKFATAEGEQIWFTSGGCTLAVGETRVTLFCPTAVTGRLALELSQIRFSRIIFQYSHRPISPRNLAPDPRNAPLTAQQPHVHFPRDHQALDIYTELPRTIHLDQGRHAIICIAAGRNHIVKLSFKVTTPTADLSFAFDSAQIIEGAAKVSPSAPEGSLVMEGIHAATIVKIQLPVVGPIRDASIDYFTTKRPTTRRIIRRAVSYPVALPLAVNVQDFFREDCLLSKFSVTTDGLRGLKVRSAHLEAVAGIVVKPCRSPKSSTLTILPLQTANFLFKIVREPAAVVDPLRLTLTYCSVEDQLQARIHEAITSVIASSDFIDDVRWFLELVSAEICARTNLHEFSTGGRFDHLQFRQEAWSPVVELRFGTRAEQALEAVRMIYEALREGGAQEPETAWRTLTIPVELPSLNILNLVHIAASFNRVEVGQAIPITLSIRPTFSWSNGGVPDPLVLSYDITAKMEDWLISGRKKGEFEAKDGEETAIRLTLVPLRAGALFLPSVAIRPISPSRHPLSCETQHLNAATNIEVLPTASQGLFVLDLDGIVV